MRTILSPQVNQLELVHVLQALSDPTRLEIVRRLRTEDKLTCSELNGSRPKSSMSHHFKTLRESGVIITEVIGKEHYNRLRSDDLEQRFPGLLDAVLKAT